MAEVEYKLFVYILIIAIVVSIIFHIFTYQKDEGFSEIYFEGDVPNYVSLNESYEFTFSIVNHEDKATTFAYEPKIELFNLHDTTEGIYRCVAKNRKKVFMEWFGNETLYTESDDYGNITWPYYTIQYTYTNLLEGGTFTTIFHNEEELYSFTIYEDSSEVEFKKDKSKWKKVNLTANNKILINATDGLQYYLNDELVFNESIDMPTNGKIDFRATTLPSVHNLVIYRDSPIEVTKSKYIRDYEIDASVIMKKLQEMRKDVDVLRHEINITQENNNLTKYFDNPQANVTVNNLTEELILSSVNASNLYGSESYLQNGSVEGLSWKNYTLNWDFQIYTQRYTSLFNIDDFMVLFHNDHVFFIDGTKIEVVESPVEIGPNQLRFQATDNNIVISVNELPIYEIEKELEFNNVSIIVKKSIMALGNILVTKKSCVGPSCRRVYRVYSFRRVMQRRNLKATADPQIISAGLKINPLLGVAAIFAGYSPLNDTLSSLFLDYDIELDRSLINEDIESEEYIFAGENAKVINQDNYSFSFSFDVLEGLGLLETSFHTNDGKKIATLILNQPENQSYLYTNLDTITRRTAEVGLSQDRRHRVDVLHEDGKSTFYLDGRKMFSDVEIDMSNGFFSISTLNTHYTIMGIALFDRSTRGRVPFSIAADPCRLRKIKEVSLEKKYLYLDIGEKAKISRKFMIKKDFDFGKVSVVMPDKEIHFWVINDD